MLNRRSILKIGALGLCGLNALNANASTPRRARAKSVILLHQYGGPSHLDTFDMKPDAPEQVRGAYRPIQTSAPGRRPVKPARSASDRARGRSRCRCWRGWLGRAVA